MGRPRGNRAGRRYRACEPRSRIRYMVPLMAVEAIGAGIAVGAVPLRRVRAVCAVGLLVLAGYGLRPLDAAAPMVAEAQWDQPNLPVRDRVTACIAQPLG